MGSRLYVVSELRLHFLGQAAFQEPGAKTGIGSHVRSGATCCLCWWFCLWDSSGACDVNEKTGVPSLFLIQGSSSVAVPALHLLLSGWYLELYSPETVEQHFAPLPSESLLDFYLPVATDTLACHHTGEVYVYLLLKVKF